jgi:hypothetical protein
MASVKMNFIKSKGTVVAVGANAVTVEKKEDRPNEKDKPAKKGKKKAVDATDPLTDNPV